MFKKGQLVTFLQNWDHKGTIRAVQLTVYSCGAKQMVLVDDQGQKFAGANFRPQEAQWLHSRVVARVEGAALEAAAMEVAAEVKASERAHFERCLAAPNADEGYRTAIRASLAKMLATPASFTVVS